MGILARVRDQILDELKTIERQTGVRVVYACESGSRAWGFPSQDSDYDVRFLYIHPRDYYLSIDIEHQRDVIERPISDELDISGWDLRKALQLLRKSNPPLLEWLDSPIIYGDSYEIAAGMRGLLGQMYSPTGCAHHYLQMARRNYKDYLRGESVRHKKYFYALRPLLAVKWIEEERGIVPMQFCDLLRTISEPSLLAVIHDLLERKRASGELDVGPQIPELNRFIETELISRENAEFHFPESKAGRDSANAFFRQSLETVWRSS